MNLIPTYLLSYTVSQLRLIIGQVFASESGLPHFNLLAGGDRLQYAISDTWLTGSSAVAETALQGGLVIANSGRLELRDNIYG